MLLLHPSCPAWYWNRYTDLSAWPDYLIGPDTQHRVSHAAGAEPHRQHRRDQARRTASDSSTHVGFSFLAGGAGGTDGSAPRCSRSPPAPRQAVWAGNAAAYGTGRRDPCKMRSEPPRPACGRDTAARRPNSNHEDHQDLEDHQGGQSRAAATPGPPHAVPASLDGQIEPLDGLTDWADRGRIRGLIGSAPSGPVAIWRMEGRPPAAGRRGLGGLSGERCLGRSANASPGADARNRQSASSGPPAATAARRR